MRHHGKKSYKGRLGVGCLDLDLKRLIRSQHSPSTDTSEYSIFQ